MDARTPAAPGIAAPGIAAPNTRLYLDYAASAPEGLASKAATRAYEESDFAGANPNSLHTPGRSAARALDAARADLARCLGGRFRPSEIVFTSGGTESNNIALFGMAEGARRKNRQRTQVIVSAIEHDSILDVASPLRERGFEVVFVAPTREGIVTAEALEQLVGPQTALVSVMAANNETGIVQPIATLAHVAHLAGALFHTDAVQAFGRIPLELAEVDAVSIAAHKIAGPVGIGALALRARTPFRAQSFGGGQEAGRRAGTQDVRGALAFAAAARDCVGQLADRRKLTADRARRLCQRLCVPGSHITPTVSSQVDRLPGLVSLLVDGLDSETLVLALDEAGFAVSAGSACSSGSLEPSHVLTAMGIPRDVAFGSLRVSFDERVSDDDLARFADALLDVVAIRRST
jgi:cysteine desulfurase